MLQKEALINHSALEHNLNFFKEKIGNKKLVACVKANAYGHGFYEVMPILSNADLCYVHSWDAAIRLRRDYPSLPIVLAGFIGDIISFQHIADENIDWVVFNQEQISILESSEYNGSSINVWLKVDTGMNRLGFSEVEAHNAINRLEHSPFVKNIIIMTHYACATDMNNKKNQEQFDQFERFANTYPYFHTSAGATALTLQNYDFLGDYVRIGAGLYGLSPFSDQSAERFGLLPVMTLRAKVINIKKANKGDSVGYNQKWFCDEDCRLAVISIGYGDGYSRSIQNGAPIFINESVAKVVGQISMDTIVVKLPNDLQVSVGDWAELWGKNISVDTIANYASTIGYELVTMIGRRVKRTIVRN